MFQSVAVIIMAQSLFRLVLLFPVNASAENALLAATAHTAK